MDSSPSHIVYTEHLSTKGRGPALWIPELDLNLPPEYREQGVSIGDVGIIKPSGSFDFFFNINHPAGHPINSDRPSDFQPLDPPLGRRDTSIIEIFRAGSFLASSSIKRVLSGTINGYDSIIEPCNHHLSQDTGCWNSNRQHLKGQFWPCPMPHLKVTSTVWTGFMTTSALMLKVGIDMPTGQSWLVG